MNNMSEELRKIKEIIMMKESFALLKASINSTRMIASSLTDLYLADV